MVALKVLEKKFPASESAETVIYVCSKCGKRARAKDKFCNECGGAVEQQVKVNNKYVCTKCGKEATAKDKFCNACGGEIAIKAPPPPENKAESVPANASEPSSAASAE